MKFFKNTILESFSSACIKKWKPCSIVMLFCTLFLTTGCVEELTVEEPGDDTPGLEVDGEYLSFTIKVDKDPSTRAGENWTVGLDSNSVHADAEKNDDYVDTQDKFRVFFFDKETGDFIFGAIDRTIAKGTTGEQNANVYTVRIPLNVVVDRQGNEYPVEKLRNYLRTHDFKVAVLANWPNGGERINPGDYDDGDMSGSFGENPSSTLKGNPLWGYCNSVLYDPYNDESDSALRDKIGEKDVKNINDLHHLFDESNEYASTTTSATRPISNNDCYSPFMGLNDDGKPAMGEPTDWVKMRNVEDGWHADYEMKYLKEFNSKSTANQWIRANWNPEVNRNINKQIYRHYQHLWYLWNFDASYKYGLYRHSTTGGYLNYASAYQSNFGWDNGFKEGVANTWGPEWYNRNGEKFYDWMHGSSSINTLKQITILSGSGQNDSFFTFNAFTNNEECFMVTNEASSLNGNITYYGIRLPSRGNSMAGNESPGVFVFQARTSGTLRVKWGNGHNNSESKICIQKGKEWQREYSISAGNRYKLYDLGGTSQPNETFYDINTDDTSSPIYIYCSQGDVIIYAIEYIRGSYLFETDREGVLPTEEQGIPMYGVRDFEKLSNWENGTTVTITPINNKEFKLLRALAKVEIYIPTSFGRPRHIYMRNMNRAARCEPMDVETPIEWDETPNSHSPECEFFNIMNHGPLYNEGKGQSVGEYRNWLAWFYGSWQSAKWKNSGTQGWTFSGATAPEAGEKGYPKIFNPYIKRSDFCHFVYVGEVDGSYNKYVLYMPEKYLDDPLSPGVFNSTPAVPHIEYRFDPATSVDDKEGSLTHSEFNLDDDRCFRIYFTNYGNGVGMGDPNPNIGNVTGSSYYTYEKNAENLKYHWPIMRNHTYRFFVNGAAPDRVTVNVVISDWQHEKVVTEW